MFTIRNILLAIVALVVISFGGYHLFQEHYMIAFLSLVFVSLIISDLRENPKIVATKFDN